jgi:surface protein
MSSMFAGCYGLTSLDVTLFNTAAVTNMGSMLSTCYGLTSIDLSSFNTAAVTNISYMFIGSYGLTSLDVSSFNTAAVTNMAGMFYNCSTIDITGVDTFDITGLNSTGDLTNFMSGTTIPTARYDAILIAWDALDPFNGMSPSFGSSTYTGGGTAAAARAGLISNDSWTITDGGIA